MVFSEKSFGNKKNIFFPIMKIFYLPPLRSCGRVVTPTMVGGPKYDYTKVISGLLKKLLILSWKS